MQGTYLFSEVTVATTRLHRLSCPSYSTLLQIVHPLASKSCELDPVLLEYLLCYIGVLHRGIQFALPWRILQIDSFAFLVRRLLLFDMNWIDPYAGNLFI